MIVLEAGLFLGRFDRVARAGEIQVHRNLAREHDRQVRDHAAFAGGRTIPIRRSGQFSSDAG